MLKMSKSKFLDFYNLIMEELTVKQKMMVDKYTAKRPADMSFGSMFKEQRTYFDLSESSLPVLQIPTNIVNILDEEGYYCPDYRQPYVYKKDDKLKNKPVKLLKILSKNLKNDQDKFNQLKKQFDERLSTSRKENVKCKICITHHPYDVAAMSTDRNWTSCMELDKGLYKDTPLKQVQYGGMCAYLINENDLKVTEPYARIAIKRLVADDPHNFIFQPETEIYGDKKFAYELKFMTNVQEILKKSNEETQGEAALFTRKDGKSWSDGSLDEKLYIDKVLKMKDLSGLSKNAINRISTIKDLPLDFIEAHAPELNLTLFLRNLISSDYDHEELFNKNLAKDFISKYKQYIDINKMINDHEFYALDNEWVYEEFENEINWHKLTYEIEHIPINIFDRHFDEFNFTNIILKDFRGNSEVFNSENDKYKSYVDEIKKKVDWDFVSKNIKADTVVNWEFVEYFNDFVNWDIITDKFLKYPMIGIPEYVLKHLNPLKLAEKYPFRKKTEVIDFVEVFGSNIEAMNLLRNNKFLPAKLKKELAPPPKNNDGTPQKIFKSRTYKN